MIATERLRAGTGFFPAAMGCSLAAAAAIYFIVSGNRLLGYAIVGIAAAAITPRSVLLAGAIVVRFLYPELVLAGELIPSDLLLGAFLARQGIRMLTPAIREGIFSSRHSQLLLAFLLWAWLGLLLVQSWETSLALGRITVYAAVFFALMTDETLGPPIFRMLSIFAVFEAVLGLAGITPRQEIRLLGHYGDPHQFGLLMLTGLAGTCVMRPSARRLIFPILLAGVVHSFTRGIWLSTTVGLLTLFAPQLTRKRAVFLGLAAALVVGFLAIEPLITSRLSLNPETKEYRLLTIDIAIDTIVDRPVFGAGWAVGTLDLPEDITPPYNLWINLAASTGILGAILFTAFLLALLRALAYSTQPVARGALMYLSGFLVLSLAEMLFYANAPSSAMAFFIVTGAGVATARAQARRKQIDRLQHQSRHELTGSPRERSAAPKAPAIDGAG